MTCQAVTSIRYFGGIALLVAFSLAVSNEVHGQAVAPSTRKGPSASSHTSPPQPQTPSNLSFLPGVLYPFGGVRARAVATADLNHDGKMDVVTVAYCFPLGSNCTSGIVDGAGELVVLFGNGDGTLRDSGVVYPIGGSPSSLVIADLNGDGIPDVVVASECSLYDDCSYSAVNILIGNGDGTFNGPYVYHAGGHQHSADDTSVPFVAVGDVNGDGKPDIVAVSEHVTTDTSNGAVGVLLGNGDGTFQPVVTYDPGGLGTTGVVLADVNGDGKLDALVVNCEPDAGGCEEGSVGVLLGNGDGTLRPVVLYDSGGVGSTSIAAADLNHDGKPDIVVGSCGTSGLNCTGAITVLLNKGDGTFLSPVDYPAAGIFGGTVLVQDLDGDGNADAVLPSYAGELISVYFGNPDGTFQAPVTFPSVGAGPEAVAATDLNGDELTDLVIINLCNVPDCQGSAVSVLLGNTTSRSSTTTALVASPARSIYGQTVTLTAKVSSASGVPTGPVVFYNGTANLGSATLAGGMASLNVATLPVGTDSITATYQGSLTLAASTSRSRSEQVSQAATTVALSSSVNPASAGQPIGLTAVVTGQNGGAASGTVTFYSGADALGTRTLFSSNEAFLFVSFATAGTYSLTAQYSGDANDKGNVSTVLSQKIVNATSATISSSLNPAQIGQAVTFTATIKSSVGSPPNGEAITFYNNKKLLGTGILSAGMATFTTSSLTTGVHSIEATYAGDSNFGASNSISLRQVVNFGTRTATETALASSLNPSTYGQKVTLTAVVTGTGAAPTGRVNFNSGNVPLGSATLDGTGTGILNRSNLPAGGSPIVAVYVGDNNNLGSSSSALNQIVQPATSASAVVASPNPAVVGQPVTITASVSSPTVLPAGPVTFTVGKTSIGTAPLSKVSNHGAQASITTTALPVGEDTITATFAGDSNIQGSSANLVETVTKSTATASKQAPPPRGECSTRTVLTTSNSPWYIGADVFFTAQLIAPEFCDGGFQTCAGNMELYDNNHYLAIASVGGPACSATLDISSLKAGTHKIKAVFEGWGSWMPSSASITQVIQYYPTTTGITSSLNPSIYGQPVTLTAVVNSSPLTGGLVPSGNVSFKYAGRYLGVAPIDPDTGTASLTLSNLSADPYPIIAVYRGDGYNGPSTSPIFNQVVVPTTSAANIASSANPSTVGESVTFTAIINSPTVAVKGPVTFTAGKTVLGTVELFHGKASVTTSSLPAGTTMVMVTFPGDSNIASSVATISQAVQ